MGLFTDQRIKLISLKLSMKVLRNLIQLIKNLLSDFNIEFYHNGHYIICKNKTLVSRSVSNNARNYYLFCTIFGLKHIIKSLSSVTCRNTSLIDHILASIPSQLSQHGVINIIVSDHQLIYCTRN